MMMMVSAGGKPLRNLVRRWQDLSGGQGLRIPLSGRSGVEGSGENPADLLLDSDPDPDPGEGPAKVPRGYLAVYVGPEMRRFVIPARYLGVPAMRVLMERAAEEFGYEQRGGLRIPCEEASFQEILSVLDRRRRRKKKKLMLM
ncbi:auxin-induced protein 15A-like protein [Cinnamomum micranthum f. kanehirae]|uniref:Auxin-induced protein 15A-like protein n=1 Tax=Cinnamomum micranthum f. kanehirae TaxID=337451 RepID=A0A3S3QW70_9MAGN|nr:auxin-induced protein 15A-like protein [Cinnamomum micranthum f. kanehirae]